MLAPFETHTVYCIGRNYAEHAAELKNAVPTEPVVFIKPRSSLCASGSHIILPAQSRDVHHEVEIVVAISKSGKNISLADADQFILGYAVGIDVTARDLQEKAKKAGLPWSVAKGFDTFAPVSDFVPRSQVSFPLAFHLQVNGVERQRGNTDTMLFSIPQLITYLSSIFTLEKGDLIFTGTPKGVAPLHSGDDLVATLGDGLAELRVSVR